MKESLRRLILFTVIVGMGSIMILFDVPLIVLIPLTIGFGFIILMALGAIKISDLREILQKLKLPSLKKQIPDSKQRDKEEKKALPKETKKPVSSNDGKTAKKPGNKTGIRASLNSFATSLGSLGTIFRERSKRSKKVEEINTLLDKTVSEKVSRTSPSAGSNPLPPQTSAPVGGAGSLPSKEEDPFLSLSGDEFDEGLLADLDEQDILPTGGGALSPGPADSSSIPDDTSGSLPEPDFSSEAETILKANSSGLDEFDGLDSSADTADQDFEDLENINIDDVDFGDDSLEGTGEISEESQADEVAAPSQSNPAAEPAGPVEVKNDWIASDAIPEDEISTQADMASFAGGHGTDDDLLSSIASDVKHVKKESDLSLLRELKDFRAPADEIANELTAVYERINSLPKQDRKKPAQTKKIE